MRKGLQFTGSKKKRRKAEYSKREEKRRTIAERRVMRRVLVEDADGEVQELIMRRGIHR